MGSFPSVDFAPFVLGLAALVGALILHRFADRASQVARRSLAENQESVTAVITKVRRAIHEGVDMSYAEVVMPDGASEKVIAPDKVLAEYEVGDDVAVYRHPRLQRYVILDTYWGPLGQMLRFAAVLLATVGVGLTILPMLCFFNSGGCGS